MKITFYLYNAFITHGDPDHYWHADRKKAMSPASTKIHQLSTLRLTDLNGRIVLEKSGLPAQGTLDLSQVPGGLYQITVTGEKKQLSRKIIVLP